jgi:peptidoglycan hydrolase-like protein with peptidoglycan-binding domain
MANLNSGDKGAGVLILQGTLHFLGYDITDIDGIFGGETEDAVRAFQEDMGLDADGIVGEGTANAIVSELWSSGYDEDDDGGDV